jgi:DNA topoisomerase-1
MPLVMEVGFTRDLEERLDDIEEGKADYLDVLGKFYGEFSKELKAASKSMPSTKEGWPCDQRCPKCSSAMTRRLSKFGFFYACQSEKCKAMMNVGPDGKPEERPPQEPTGIKCDNCKGDTFLSKGRFGPYIHCARYKDKKDPCKFTMAITKHGEPRRKMTPVPTDVDCPKCKKHKMVVRIASRGKAKPFLSCPGFPRCRAAEDLPKGMESLGEQAMAGYTECRRRDLDDLAAFRAFTARQPKESEE